MAAPSGPVRAQHVSDTQPAPGKHIDLSAARRHRRWPVIVAVLAVVLVGAGTGLWAWHEQPAFCNAFCHTPMDTFVKTYDQDLGSAGVDKWGNAVADTSAMLVVTHRAAGADCLSCHEPSLAQQVGEVAHELSGDYEYPLAEGSLETLMVHAGNAPGSGEQFCLKSGCHDVSKDQLKAKTAAMAWNPHQWQHDTIACSDCHKAHRASVFACTNCHDDALASVPDGWLTAEEGEQIREGALAG